MISRQGVQNDIVSGGFNVIYFFEFDQQRLVSSDIVQLSRSPEDMKDFAEAFRPRDFESLEERAIRFWQITNTRYLLGAAGSLNILNERFDPERRRFRILERFQMQQRPGISNAKRWDELEPSLDLNGPLALFEFTGALPRARLYYHWQSIARGPEALDLLTSRSFDPEQAVLVTGALPSSSAPAPKNQMGGGVVEIIGYEPKKILLKADSTFESILLLNDRYDPNWKVLVDGKPDPLLICNYLMRGVHLAPGSHIVEFRFRPPLGGLYITLCAIAFGCVLLGFLSLAKAQSASQLVPIQSAVGKDKIRWSGVGKKHCA